MQTAFEMQPDYYAEIGAILRRAREEKGLTTEQAAQRLHIRTQYVHALEEGNLGELPGAIYTRGYLRAYVVFLKLDRREIMRRFELVENSLVGQRFYLPHVFSREKKPSRRIIGGSCFFALACYMFWVMVIKLDRVDLPVVEPVPGHTLKQGFAPLITYQKVACFNLAESLYPPCHIDKMHIFYLSPLSHLKDMEKIKNAAP